MSPSVIATDDQPPAPSEHVLRQDTASAPQAPQPPLLSPPPGPIAAEPSPAQSQQVRAASDPGELKRAYDLVKQYVTASQANPPATPPRPEPPAAGPGNSIEFVPPGPATPAEGPAATGRSRPGSTKAKTARIESEGDGRLTMNFKNEDIRNVLEMLSAQGNLNILSSNSVQGTVSAALNGVDLDHALTAILRSTGYVARHEGSFIYVGTPQDFEQMQQSQDKIGTRVYRPNYVPAAELQALILPLLTTKVGVVSVSKPSEVGIGASPEKAGGDSFAGGEVVLVRDYEAVLAQVDQIVTETDVRPMQVSIEAMILSVKLTDKDQLGINWQLLLSDPRATLAIGSPVPTVPADFTSGGLTFAYLGGNVGSFVQALEEINETNVIASPKLMVMNKQRAEVQIGRQQGYVGNTTQTETSTTSQIQMLDTGTILRLRPFITSDGLVRMEVHPELSSGDVVVKGQNLVPDKEITQVTSNVMVRDGCTVIIGGLMREQLTNHTTQLPVLGNLKWVGPLFRNKTETVERQEILVLITPRIVYEPGTCREGQQALCEFQRREGVYADSMSCVGKRSVARQLARRALAAEAEGNPEKARRLAGQSVHWDPENREAIELASRLTPGVPSCRPANCPPATPGSLDQEKLAPWLLNDLERDRPPAVQHPLDPGTPGPRKDISRPRNSE